jgi:hypothetical protein
MGTPDCPHLTAFNASLDRINNLMADLKKLSAHRDQSKPH